jgi:hypothetical protein
LELGTYIVRQMEGVRGLLGDLLDGVTPAEWVASPAPGENAIGFIAWHVPSIQDWAVHTWMQNVPTVRSRPEWEAKGMNGSFLPVGMGLEAAHSIAKATSSEDVLSYADAVLDAVRAFVMRLPADGFDAVPASRAHLADPRYQVARYRADVDDMYEQPYWQLFVGACSGHCRGHLGELELALSLVRRR